MKELKYKVDDEVLLKGKVVNTDALDETSYPYKIRFDDDNIAGCPLWFTESSIAGMAGNLVKVDDCQKTYEQGLNDAWEMAKLINFMPLDGGLTAAQLTNIYDIIRTYDIMKQYSAQEAISKYNTWKEYNDIKMGDVVEYDVYAGLDTSEIHRAIFYSETADVYWILRDQCLTPQQLTKAQFKLRKVGESGLDIAGALARIRDKED